MGRLEKAEIDYSKQKLFKNKIEQTVDMMFDHIMDEII